MAVTESGHLASREVDDLYRRHGADVYRYAYAVLGNHADAEDVTQTTFLNAYRSLEQGVRPRKPANWLLTIASNAIKQRFRQEQARPRQVELDDRLTGHELVDDDETPSVGELLTALSKIPPQQRQAIVLREFEGRSYNEIAEILGVTTSALETLLFRARRSLAEELEHRLTCTDAQQAVSKAVDGRLGRKERRRLKDHLSECPDCAHFARLQKGHRSALRGLMLLPIPLSLTLFKGLEGAGTASAATLHAVPAAGSAVGGGASTATSAGVGVGTGTATTSGGFFAGGVAIKAAAAVVAVTVASGAAVTGALEISRESAAKTPAVATTSGKPLGQKTAPKGTAPVARATRNEPAATGNVEKTNSTSPSRRSAAPSVLGATASSTTAHTVAPEHTAAPEQTSGPEHATPPERTSAPEQTSTPTTRTTAPKPAPKSKPKRTNKGKRIAGAKRANTTKSGAPSSAKVPNPKATPTQPPPVGSGNNNGNANGSANGNTDPAAGQKPGQQKP